MKKAPRPSRRSTSAGFSTLEALVALLLVAVVGLVAVQAVTGGMKAWRAGRARAADSVLLLQLDSALRRAVGAVVVPYWVGQRRGRRSRPRGSASLTAEAKRRAPCASAPPTAGSSSKPWTAKPASRPVRVGPFAEAAVAPLFEEQRLWGVLATVRLREGMDAVALRARIGSRPLLAEAAP